MFHCSDQNLVVIGHLTEDGLMTRPSQLFLPTADTEVSRIGKMTASVFYSLSTKEVGWRWP
jgi:hypothetical protein